jgi:thiosulfate/3-mercaptopyruvate sulfurtransferase
VTVPPLVDAAWLRERLGDPDVRVVDCRFVLGDPSAAARRYAEGHVAGAAFLDVDADLSAVPAAPGPRGPVGGRHPLPARADLQAALRRAGVRASSHVVAYDDALTGGAARLWWLLRHHGHARVSVLRGGLGTWDGPVRAGAEAIAPGDIVLGDGRADDVADADAVGARGGAVLLDARAPERFRGDAEPVDPVAGHVPGARNLPATAAWPVPPDLLEPGRELIASCGSGVSACVLLLALADAGRDEARLYAGSWSDWVARGLPVATGDDDQARLSNHSASGPSATSAKRSSSSAPAPTSSSTTAT